MAEKEVLLPANPSPFHLHPSALWRVLQIAPSQAHLAALRRPRAAGAGEATAGETEAWGKRRRRRRRWRRPRPGLGDGASRPASSPSRGPPGRLHSAGASSSASSSSAGPSLRSPPRDPRWESRRAEGGERSEAGAADRGGGGGQAVQKHLRQAPASLFSGLWLAPGGKQASQPRRLPRARSGHAPLFSAANHRSALVRASQSGHSVRLQAVRELLLRPRLWPTPLGSQSLEPPAFSSRL